MRIVASPSNLRVQPVRLHDVECLLLHLLRRGFHLDVVGVVCRAQSCMLADADIVIDQ